jgi:hypothetical protein
MLVERNLILQLENVQLQITATEIFGLEAEIVAGDRLHAQHRLVEIHRLIEIAGTDRKVIEAGNFHGRPPLKAKYAAAQRDQLKRSAGLFIA